MCGLLSNVEFRFSSWDSLFKIHHTSQMVYVSFVYVYSAGWFPKLFFPALLALPGNPLRLGNSSFSGVVALVVLRPQFFSLMYNSCHVWCSLQSTLPTVEDVMNFINTSSRFERLWVPSDATESVAIGPRSRIPTRSIQCHGWSAAPWRCFRLVRYPSLGVTSADFRYCYCRKYGDSRLSL